MLLALCLFAPVHAQSMPAPIPFPELEPITIENASHLAQLPGELTGVTEGFDVSPDGKQVAVARPDGVYLYDMGSFETPAKIFEVSSADQVYGPQFSPDGQTLAVNVIYRLPATEVTSDLPGSEFKSTVQLWDMQIGAVKTELIGRLGLASHPVFSPDGHYIAGKNSLSQTIQRPAEGYSELQIWELNNSSSSEPRCCAEDLSGRYGIGDIAFSPDSLILLWSIGEPDFANGGYGIEIFWRIEYLPSILSDDSDLGVLTKITSNNVDRIFLASEAPFTPDVRDIEFSADGKWLATVGEYSKIWDVKTAEIHATLPEGSQFLAFLLDDSIIVNNDPQQQLYVTNLDQTESAILLEHFDQTQQTILLNSNGTILALHENDVIIFYGVPAESKSTL